MTSRRRRPATTRRTAPVALLVASVALGIAVGLGGCAAATSTGDGGSTADAAASGTPCPTGPVAPAPPPASPSTSPSPTPTPGPTLDPTVAHELRSAITAVRAIDGVATARYDVTVASNDQPDTTCPGRILDHHSFSAVFTVVMAADSTTDDAGRVPTAMAQNLAWTAVNLVLTVPATTGRVATTIEYDGTFDQTIPLTTSRSVAEGLATIASTPHVAGVSGTIPYTMRVDYGSLTVGADTDDPATLDGIRAVIDGTAFRDTTLHGSFGNGAKP